MNAPHPSAPSLVTGEHRGWTLRARLLRSLSSEGDGWVCYATRPTAAQELNLGRWLSSDAALEHGRAYIDQRVDAPLQAPLRPGVPKRRP